MESIILGIILGLVTYFALVGPFGIVWAIILSIVVFILESRPWHHIADWRRP